MVLDNLSAYQVTKKKDNDSMSAVNHKLIRFAPWGVLWSKQVNKLGLYYKQFKGIINITTLNTLRAG